MSTIQSIPLSVLFSILFNVCQFYSVLVHSKLVLNVFFLSILVSIYFSIQNHDASLRPRYKLIFQTVRNLKTANLSDKSNEFALFQSHILNLSLIQRPEMRKLRYCEINKEFIQTLKTSFAGKKQIFFSQRHLSFAR